MFNEYLPQSECKSLINGVCMEQVLVERIYCEQSLNINSIRVFSDWIFKIGVYKGGEKYYLLLDLNDHNTIVDSMIEEGCCPNTGFICISKEKAEDLIIKISELGKEYFLNTFSNFQEVINIICSAISCEVYFENRLNEGGLVSTETNGVRRIYIANNQSQLMMLFSLLHEFAHFQLNSQTASPSKMIDYIFDEEENWCNGAALVLAWEIIKDVFFKESENILSQDIVLYIDLIKLRASIEKYMDCDTEKREEYFIKIKEKIQLFYKKIVENRICCGDIIRLCEAMLLSKNNDELICEMGKKIISQINKNNTILKYDCRQSGLVVLSSTDNQKLYDIIINEISPLMPNEDEYDEF